MGGGGGTGRAGIEPGGLVLRRRIEGVVGCVGHERGRRFLSGGRRVNTSRILYAKGEAGEGRDLWECGIWNGECGNFSDDFCEGPLFGEGDAARQGGGRDAHGG